jgi:EmrB/QacA subfamily drug resistance transporter
MIKYTLRGAGARIEEWRRYRHTRHTLLSMDNRALADIGVARMEIPFILRDAQRRSPRDPALHGGSDDQLPGQDVVRNSDPRAVAPHGGLRCKVRAACVSFAAGVEGAHRWWVLWTMVAAQFMFVVDAFIVNVAIPTIRADLHASPAQINAVIAVYLIAYASLVIVGGRLGDIYGAKRIFLSGLAGFILASVWCGLAHSATELIVARLVQGATAALMVPQVLATIHVLFSGEERARAFGIYGLALGFGGAAGFLGGGLLVTLDFAGLGWRLVFFVNAPVGLTTAVAAWRLMPGGWPRSGVQLDLIGTAILFVGLVCLIGPLVFGHDFHWAPELWLSVVCGALLLVVFPPFERRIERKGRAPLIDCSLLLDRRFRLGLAGAFFFFLGNLSFYLVMTLFLQSTLGYSAWEAGLTVLPLALAFVVASRRGSKGPATSPAGVLEQGCVCQIVGLGGLALLTMAIDRPTASLLALPLMIFGYGQGLVMAPLSSAVLSSVQKASAGAGSGLYAVAAQIANAAGVAAIGTLFSLIEATVSAHAAILASLAAVGGVLGASAILLKRMHHAPMTQSNPGGNPRDDRSGQAGRAERKAP